MVKKINVVKGTPNLTCELLKKNKNAQYSQKILIKVSGSRENRLVSQRRMTNPQEDIQTMNSSGKSSLISYLARLSVPAVFD